MERRSLTNGMHAIPNADPVAVRQFVNHEMPKIGAADCVPLVAANSREALPRAEVNEDEAYGRPPRKRSGMVPVALIPVTVRLHPNIAIGLKRASLERQLAGEEIYTQQELVEQALEPWLKSLGYLA